MLIAAAAIIIVSPAASTKFDQATKSVTSTANTFIDSINTQSETQLLPSMRTRSWNSSLRIISSHPLYGVGRSNEVEMMREHGSIRLLSNKVIVTHGAF